MNTGSALARFTITLSQAVTEPVQVEWFTSDGTAKAGVDYAANKGTVVFAPGETAKTVDILVYGRAVGSEDRSFFVEMLPPTNAILGASIGECIITVDTSGSTPVTAIIVPTGPKGEKGDPGEDGVSPDPAEIALEVAPLIDVGATVLTAEGTETLGHPDQTTVKAVARRVAYAGAAKVATLALADGENTIASSLLTGDDIDFNSTGFVPRILRGTSMFEPQWSLGDNGDITLVAQAGDVLYAVQYLVVSQERNASDIYEPLGFNKLYSFEDGVFRSLKSEKDIVYSETDGEWYQWRGTYPKSVPEASTPGSTGGISANAWFVIDNPTLRGADGANRIGSSYGGTVYSDFSPSRFIKKGTFRKGGTVSKRNELFVDANGKCFLYTGTLPFTVNAGSSPDGNWLSAGYLDGYPYNNALNFRVTNAGDSTAQIRELHAFCNYLKEPASYRGLVAFSVDSTADITVYTDIDWAGAAITPIKTQNLPDWSFIPVYRVSDPETPLEVVPETWASGALFAGRTTLDNTTYSFKEGVICFDTQINYGKRYTTDSVFYKLRQVFKVYQGGLLGYPIDISIAGGTLGTVHFRKQPTNTIKLQGAKIDAAGSNQLQFLSVERNKVHVDDIQVVNAGNQDNIRTIIYGFKICDWKVTNIRGVGNEPGPSALGSGSYLIGGDFVADWMLDGIGTDGGMPNIGCNVLNGVRLQNSHVNRFDAHAFLHNAFIHKNTFGSYGVFYGIGGGILEGKDNVFIKGYIPGRGSFVDLGLFNAFNARADYGGVFYGNITLSNNTMLLDTRVDLSSGGTAYPYKLNLLSFDASGDYGFTDKKPVAYSIVLENNRCKAPSFSYNFDFAGVALSPAGLSTGSLFPERIVVDGLEFIGNPQDNHHIIPVIFPTTYANYTCNNVAAASAGNCNIRYNGIRSACTRARAADRSSIGWTPPIAEQTNANRVNPYVQVDNCTGISLRWSINGSTVLVNNSEIRDFSTASSGTPTNNINFSNSQFYFVDGSQSQLANARVYNSRVLRQSAGTGNVQFGGILSVQGVTLGPGITLVNGGNTSITVDSIFTGYKS